MQLQQNFTPTRTSLRIEWKESVHAGLDLLAKCISFLLSKGLLRHGPLGFKLLQLRVQAVHRLDKIGTTELHVADTRWLEDATSGVRVRVPEDRYGATTFTARANR